MQSFEHELKFGNVVIGVDEVGRGCLAGPVVAAAIKVDKRIIDFKVNDSKKLSSAKRNIIYSELIKTFEYAIGVVSVEEIEQINILNATKKAMRIAIESLLDYESIPIIVDGNAKPFNAQNMHAVIKADSIMPSVAAASIIAKVARDTMMLDYSKHFPLYNWHTNVGYGTKQHTDAISQYGICEHHRKSFLRKIVY